MEKLTAQQAKMVLEYFAQQAAEDAPILDGYEKHLWMTRMQVSIAVERQVREYDWDELVTTLMAYQSFDRDPDGYLHRNGYKVTAAEREHTKGNLQDEVSFAIDNCWNNSGA